jgi:vacuolar-type H+-ATPase subunit H
MQDKPQDESIKDQIIALLGKGYSRIQLIRDFGFAERTADNAIKEYKEQHGEEADEAKKGNDSDTKALALPAKLDIKQVIAPEYLIKHLSFVNGDQRQTFIDALLVYEAARRSVMEDVVILQGLAAANAQTTETQLRVLREAKSEGREIAQAAAEEAALRVGQQVVEAARQAATAGSPNPMASMLTQTIQPYFAQMIGRMFGMLGGFGQPPGPMPNQPGQPPQQSPPQGQASVSTPGVEQVSKEEIKEVFGDD